jgi:hypothetical protein
VKFVVGLFITAVVFFSFYLFGWIEIPESQHSLLYIISAATAAYLVLYLILGLVFGVISAVAGGFTGMILSVIAGESERESKKTSGSCALLSAYIGLSIAAVYILYHANSWLDWFPIFTLFGAIGFVIIDRGITLLVNHQMD